MRQYREGRLINLVRIPYGAKEMLRSLGFSQSFAGQIAKTFLADLELLRRKLNIAAARAEEAIGDNLLRSGHR